jgi:hypothetical protein
MSYSGSLLIATGLCSTWVGQAPQTLADASLASAHRVFFEDRHASTVVRSVQKEEDSIRGRLGVP